MRERGFFYEKGVRAHKFCLERFGIPFLNAFRTQMERERSFRLFLSGTVSFSKH